jgi:hypothetical protein
MFAWSQPLESITERYSARECSTDKRYSLFLNSVNYTKKSFMNKQPFLWEINFEVFYLNRGQENENRSKDCDWPHFQHFSHFIFFHQL